MLHSLFDQMSSFCEQVKLIPFDTNNFSSQYYLEKALKLIHFVASQEFPLKFDDTSKLLHLSVETQVKLLRIQFKK